jgi:biotin transport system substrate-specific component
MKVNVRDMTLVALFAALMVVGAYVRIPLPMVPVTFQPFFCAFAGILLGARLGLLSQLVYIAMGLLGLPVFSGGGGVTYIFKPTFGYILGFAAAAYVIGKISEKLKKSDVFSNLAALITGLIVIYAVGVPYTYVILKFYLNQPGARIVWSSVVPFLVKDFLLFVLIALTAVKIVPAVRYSR